MGAENSKEPDRARAAPMDRLEFVVRERHLGVGPSVCIEPIINGQSLDEMLRPPDRETSGYAGLPPETLYRPLHDDQPASVVTH